MTDADEIKKLEEASDIVGEHIFNTLRIVMLGLGDNGLLSLEGRQHAAAMMAVDYSEIPEAEREKMRADGRVLILKILEKIA